MYLTLALIVRRHAHRYWRHAHRSLAPFVAVSAFESGNRHKWPLSKAETATNGAKLAPRGAKVLWWRQLGGGANWRSVVKKQIESIRMHCRPFGVLACGEQQSEC